MSPQDEQELMQFILASNSPADGAFEFIKVNRQFVGDPEVERLILQDVGVALGYMATEKLCDWPELYAVIEAHPDKVALRFFYSKIFNGIIEPHLESLRPKRRRIRKSDKSK